MINSKCRLFNKIFRSISSSRNKSLVSNNHKHKHYLIISTNIVEVEVEINITEVEVEINIVEVKTTSQAGTTEIIIFIYIYFIYRNLKVDFYRNFGIINSYALFTRRTRLIVILLHLFLDRL